MTEIISKTAENIFIPLTVGGGIRTLEDINKSLRAGADKVAINTAAIENPNFINEASKAFGSSTIVVAIETTKEENSYLAYTDNGREFTGKDVFLWAKEVEDRGAGEILITSIDKDGTGTGFDIDLVRMISDSVKIPLIAHGGASNASHIIESIENGKSDAVAISSMLHYNAIKKNKIFNNEFIEEGNIEFLKQNNSFKMFGDDDLRSIQNELKKNHISLRNI